MSENKKEIEGLFKNIQEGLKKYTIKELNVAIKKVIKDDDDCYKKKNKDIERIFEVVCDYYRLNKNNLVHGLYSRDKSKEARMLIFCLLHFELDLPIRYIAKKIFFLKYHNSVGVVIKYYKNLNLSISVDKHFNEQMELMKRRIKQKK